MYETYDNLLFTSANQFNCIEFTEPPYSTGYVIAAGIIGTIAGFLSYQAVIYIINLIFDRWNNRKK